MTISIIPKPVVLEEKDGCFTLSQDTKICASAVARPEATLVAETLRASTGYELPVVTCTADSGCSGNICLSVVDDPTMNEEAYVLDVQTCCVVIKATGRKGVFYGTQTLLQLAPRAIFRSATVANAVWEIPCVHVEDAPRFKWRGMHLDVCRHFMPKEFVKKFIDLLAFHKMNSFHWHLTEDQGWRIEIKRYPKLTSVSAWREETVMGHHGNNPRVYDGRTHGGFYTQDDVREIVAYATRRHVNVVPEIEMPGHTQAVMVAYPELGCREDLDYHVRKIWGVSQDVYCAGNEKTFEFLQNVLDEVLELFPSTYIHIGGDECPKARWKECPKCQKRIKDEGLEDEHELQSYFIKRMETYLNERGRRMIGWDEILEGGLAPNATVMSWRGTDGGVKAANDGHDVVFAPGSHTYFDHCQATDGFAEPLAIGGYLPLEKVYAYDPIPEELPEDKRGHVLGAQGQLWSEYMPNPKHVEYMAFPRLTALAEVVWTATENKDYDDYLTRLHDHLKRLDVLDVNYRRLD